MIAIVCGGRNYTDGAFLVEQMDLLHAEHRFTLIIEGGQRKYVDRRPVGGADYFAQEWALARGVEVVTVKAKWGDLSHPDAVIRTRPNGKKYDAKAGMRRNLLMWQRYQPQRVVAFSPAGSGTQNMVDIARAAKAAGADVEIIELRAP